MTADLPPIATTALPDGERVPVLGQGTWKMGEDARRRDAEIAALRHGLDLGMTLIDTAEMYANGMSEVIVGEAIAGRRDEVFLVSKVLPSHASRFGTIRACEGSLRRLDTDVIDLYLLHWAGDEPLAETIEAFGRLQDEGKIRHWGVSNFDPGDCEALFALAGGDAAAANQVLYNPGRRGIEFDLLPWCQRRGLPVMAYSPIEQGRIARHPALAAVAQRHGATPAQIALAFVLRQPGVIAIPKAGSSAHVAENRAACALALDDADMAVLDRAFPPPARASALQML
ncbi:aldo/keto reductase [Pseudoxanthobacter sp.]|uniref:aldo/keto reductase n=1 Tax=Pseudoxanthobacter sp. TaxID=1925742 RepID=UPI002FE084E1